MKNLNFWTNVSDSIISLAVVIAFVGMFIFDEVVGYYLTSSGIILAAIGVFVYTIARIFSKNSIRAKFKAGIIPIALVYFITVMLYITFFHECKALGITSSILMVIAGVYAIAAFVLQQIDETKSEQKKKGEV